MCPRGEADEVRLEWAHQAARGRRTGDRDRPPTARLHAKSVEAHTKAQQLDALVIVARWPKSDDMEPSNMAGSIP